VHRALGQALKWGIVTRNPAALVTPPRHKKSEGAALTREEVGRLLEAARESGDRVEALYVLAVHTGMRQGELLGLKWSDVDLAAKTMRVNRQAQRHRDRGGLVLAEPKNASRRTVPLTDTAVEALRHHGKRQAEERMRVGSLYEDVGLAFASEIGKPLDAQNVVNRSFKPLLKGAGLPDMRWHDLRHTAATLLLSEGVHPKLVQHLLGHASISMTLDRYSHWVPSMGTHTASAMDVALG
jgi:integrase